MEEFRDGPPVLPGGSSAGPTDPEFRLRQLEAKLARLEGLLRSAAVPATPGGTALASGGEPAGSYPRRALLRRGGVALVGAAGLLALPRLAGSAAAATGADAVLGEANSASSQTGLTASSSDASLALGNTTTTTATVSGQSVTEGVAPLNLVPSVSSAGVAAVLPDLATSLPGDLFSSGIDSSNPYSLLYFTHEAASSADGDEAIPGTVYTDFFASMLSLVAPFRILDTRSSSTRPSGVSYDSSGRVPAGTVLTVDLSDYVVYGYGVVGNLTCVNTEAAGYLTAYPGGTRPDTSSVNWTGPDQTVANFALVALGTDSSGNPTNSFEIYARNPTAILFDVTGFLVPNPGVLTSAASPAARPAAPAAVLSRTQRTSG